MVLGNVLRGTGTGEGCLDSPPDQGISRKYLGNLGDFQADSWATDINDCGQVVGWSEAGTTHERHAFVWLPEPALGLPAGMTDLTVLSGLAEAAVINNRGQIAGKIIGTREVVMWERGEVTTIPALPCPTGSAQPLDINDVGEVAGWWNGCSDSLRERGFIWLPRPAHGLGAGTHDLGGLQEYEECSTTGQCHIVSKTEALGMNDLGQVVGRSWVSQSQPVVFVWDAGSMTDAGLPVGLNYSPAINNAGDVPYTLTEGGQCPCTAHVSRAQQSIPLGTLGGNATSVADISSVGEIVGSSSLPVGTLQSSHPFLWRDGTMIDLGTLGGTLGIANAINEHSQVAGVSSFVSVTPRRATVWTLGGNLSADRRGESSSPTLRET